MAGVRGGDFRSLDARTPREFNAMVDLGIARHLAENTDGQGFMFEISLDAMMFGDDGQVNFPLDKRRMGYVQAHGTWPTDRQLLYKSAPDQSIPESSGFCSPVSRTET